MVRIRKPMESFSKRRTQIRLDWIESKGSQCNYCGSNQGPFDIDHCIPKWFTGDRPTKQIWQLGKAKREEELSKCQLLCKPCHRAKTSIEHLAIRYKKQMISREQS